MPLPPDFEAPTQILYQYSLFCSACQPYFNFFTLCVCESVCVHVHHSTPVDVRGQLVEVLGTELSHRTWQQAPPLAEPSHRPTYHSIPSETRSSYAVHP